MEEEDTETDPLKRLCKKHPHLKACQSPPKLTPTGERDTGGGIPVKEEEGAEKGTMFAVYIKAFTKAVNGE